MSCRRRWCLTAGQSGDANCNRKFGWVAKASKSFGNRSLAAGTGCGSPRGGTRNPDAMKALIIACKGRHHHVIGAVREKFIQTNEC